MIFIKCTSVQIQTEGDRYCMAKPALALKEERGENSNGTTDACSQKRKKNFNLFPNLLIWFKCGPTMADMFSSLPQEATGKMQNTGATRLHYLGVSYRCLE